VIDFKQSKINHLSYITQERRFMLKKPILKVKFIILKL